MLTLADYDPPTTLVTGVLALIIGLGILSFVIFVTIPSAKKQKTTEQNVSVSAMKVIWWLGIGILLLVGVGLVLFGFLFAFLGFSLSSK